MSGLELSERTKLVVYPSLLLVLLLFGIMIGTYRSTFVQHGEDIKDAKGRLAKLDERMDAIEDTLEQIQTQNRDVYKMLDFTYKEVRLGNIDSGRVITNQPPATPDWVNKRP